MKDNSQSVQNNKDNNTFEHNFINKKDEEFLKNTYLGKATLQSNQYNPNILQKIIRNKNAIYFGWDIWNLYELFWIDFDTNQPIVAIGVLYILADSDFIVESKSLKLYLNSLHNICASERELKKLIEKDLSDLLKTTVILHINPIEQVREIIPVPGFCLNKAYFSCNKILQESINATRIINDASVAVVNNSSEGAVVNNAPGAAVNNYMSEATRIINDASKVPVKNSASGAVVNNASEGAVVNNSLEGAVVNNASEGAAVVNNASEGAVVNNESEEAVVNNSLEGAAVVNNALETSNNAFQSQSYASQSQLQEELKNIITYQDATKITLLKKFNDVTVANFKYVFHLNNIISYCPVTSQPDFATFVICIENLPSNLLFNILNQIWQYILNKNGNSDFHESHVQRIYDYLVQLLHFYQVDTKILTYAHYTRRGGIDICPYRANFVLSPPKMLYFNRQ